MFWVSHSFQGPIPFFSSLRFCIEKITSLYSYSYIIFPVPKTKPVRTLYTVGLIVLSRLFLYCTSIFPKKLTSKFFSPLKIINVAPHNLIFTETNDRLLWSISFLVHQALCCIKNTYWSKHSSEIIPINNCCFIIFLMLREPTVHLGLFVQTIWRIVLSFLPLML